MFDLFPRLRERLDTPAGQLSGGEQQMLALAAAIGSRPRLLLLDEPSFGLAPKVVDEVFGVLGELRGGGFTILIAEQQASRVLELADHVLVLRGGRIETEHRVEPDHADELRKSVLEAYFGHEEEARGVPARAVVEELVSLRLPVALKRRLQVAARERNTEPSVLASETLAAWLKRRSG
jgi:ABC-type multidrug transport system ATPase subunit